MKASAIRYRPDSGWSSPLPAWDSPRTLVLAFGDPGFFGEPAVTEQLLAAYPEAVVLGCSTAGEIFGTSVDDGTWSVAVMQFEATTIRSATAPVDAADGSVVAGEKIGRELAGPGLAAVFVLSDGLEINGSELVRGLNEALPADVVVTGGLAGDGDRFDRTWVLADGVMRTGHVAAVGLYGDRVVVGHGSRGGWDIFGVERVVTRSEGNVLYEIDGRPALDLYKEYLGELAAGLPATALLFPLALRTDTTDREVVRTILAVDEASHSLTFAGDIPAGSSVQLMRANFDRVIGGAEEAAELAAVGDDRSDVVAIAVSCVGRRLVLGERTEEEVEACLDALPEGTLQVGFYSYGELSPYANGTCDLHNQTMTLTTITEVPDQ